MYSSLYVCRFTGKVIYHGFNRKMCNTTNTTITVPLVGKHCYILEKPNTCLPWKRRWNVIIYKVLSINSDGR